MKNIAVFVLLFAWLYLAIDIAMSWHSALDQALESNRQAADARVSQEWETERDRQAADREWLLDHPDPERGASLE